MTAPPPEDVWQALDWNAGRMPRRTFATLLAGALIVGVLGLAGLAGWRSGVLWPNIAGEPISTDWTIDTDQQSFQINFPVRNDGLVPVDIIAVGRGGQDLILLDAQIAKHHLSPGESTEISLTYQVDDCDAPVEPDSWPVPLHVSRGRTAYVDGPNITAPITGDLLWQVKLADLACGRITLIT